MTEYELEQRQMADHRPPTSKGKNKAVYHCPKGHQIPGNKIGRQKSFNREEIDAWPKSRQAAKPEKSWSLEFAEIQKSEKLNYHNPGLYRNRNLHGTIRGEVTKISRKSYVTR